MTDQDEHDQIDGQGAEVITEEENRSLALPGQVLPTHLYLLPVNNRPVFPGQIQPVVVSAERWATTINKIGKAGHQSCGLVYVGQVPGEQVGPGDFAEIGCLTKLHKPVKQEGNIQFIGHALKRFRIKRWLSREIPFLVEVEYPAEAEVGAGEESEIKAYALSMINGVKELVQINPLYSEEVKQYLKFFNPGDPSPLTDFAASLTTGKGEELQTILATLPVLARMKLVLPLLQKELQVARLQSEIRQEVNRKINVRSASSSCASSSRPSRRSWGSRRTTAPPSWRSSRSGWRSSPCPKPAQKRSTRRWRRWRCWRPARRNTRSPATIWTGSRCCPGACTRQDKLDLARGPQDPRPRPLRAGGREGAHPRVPGGRASTRARSPAPSSCWSARPAWARPPSAARSPMPWAAASTASPWAACATRPRSRATAAPTSAPCPASSSRRSRTCEDRQPGDHARRDRQDRRLLPGRPGLGPAGGAGPGAELDFLDHYLDLRFDLSKVLFICTANQLDTIPGPLLDRMEIIRLAGYIAEEKLAIARKYLLPRQIEARGLKKRQIDIQRAGPARCHRRLCPRRRGAAAGEAARQDRAQGGGADAGGTEATISIARQGPQRLSGQPGVPRRRSAMSGVGVVTGLAWTPWAGRPCPSRRRCIHEQNRGFKLTGQLGDVMKESAEIAYSYVIATPARTTATRRFFDKPSSICTSPPGPRPRTAPPPASPWPGRCCRWRATSRCRRSP